MRRLAALAGLTLTTALAACGGSDSSPTGPAMTEVDFKVDAATCSGSAAINLFVDGTMVGTETLSAGLDSHHYPTTVGTHVLSASIANTNGRTWGPTTVAVPAGGYTLLLTCQ